MTLVDTSVWIDHFRLSNPRLVRALHDGRVASHPFVIGELALGRLGHRKETIAMMVELQALDVVDQGDVLRFIEDNQLAATGIGWVDAHLLCAAALADVPIWSHDRQLRRQAVRIGLLHE